MKLNDEPGTDPLAAVKRMFCLLCTTAIVFVGLAAAQDQDPEFDSRVQNPAYMQLHPKMMLDRGHFNLRTAVGQSIDKSFAALFTNDGYDIARNDAPFEAATLREVRILVIAVAGGGKTPATWSNPAFTQEEVDLLSSWVERGGSMLLLFDHFPLAAAIEPLANRFGVQVELGLASDKAHALDPRDCAVCQDGWIEYTRKNGLLRQHPITQGRSESERLNRVVTFGGSSLTAPELKDEFLKLAASAINVRYAPGAPLDQKIRTSQAAAFHFGRGRVVMLADTNAVAAQVIRYTPNSKPLRTGLGYEGADNRQLILNIMHWLSGLFD